MIWLKSKWLIGGLGTGIFVVGILWGLFFVPYLAAVPGVIAYRQGVVRLVNVGLNQVNQSQGPVKWLANNAVNLTLGRGMASGMSDKTTWFWMQPGLSVDEIEGREYVYSAYGYVAWVDGKHNELTIFKDDGEWFNVGIKELVYRDGVKNLPVFMVGSSWQTIYSDTGWVVSRPKFGIVYDPSDLAAVICKDDLVRLKWRDSRPPQFWATWNGQIRYDILGKREILEQLRSKMEVYRIFLSAICADNFYDY
jgi:hypothetical protein